MKEEDKQDIIAAVKRNPTGVKSVLTEEEYEICIAAGIGLDKMIHMSKGSFGHKYGGKYAIGIFICIKGFYKIVDIKYNFKVPSGRIYKEMLVTYYDGNNPNEFLEEVVFINPEPLYNNVSVGIKSALSVGMILHIKEHSRIVRKSYRIVWDIISI